MADPNANTIEKQADLGKAPESIARRWKLELKLADKREETWRKKAADIYKLYTPDAPIANSFNILWTNTETLRQSVYNSLPQPDARRRYQDDDPLGKSVGEVLTRALEFAQDTYDFDSVLQDDVLAMLLPGRAVSRVRYIPDIRKTGEKEASESDDDSPEAEQYEEIAWEQTICERVKYDDFRILCSAKSWSEVTAIGFRHRFTRQDCIDKFGDDIGNALTLDGADDEDIKGATPDTSDLFKTAEIWEIWDKDEKTVIWICKTYAHPCKEQDDPLQLTGFFPIPRPLYAIQNENSLIPACLYTQYEQQAKELNKISIRINKLVDALRLRGIYDATLSELSSLMKSGDNDLIPSQNVTALLERGGLEKAIWLMPIDVAAAVIKELYLQRDATKQIIYELTGISDIMRSASDPNETFGAQKIKTQWGTQRLQRMQREVQRYIRDLVRLKAEVISGKFQMETLEAMTLVKLPHKAQLEQQKAQLVQQYQQAAQQAHMQGQPPPPPPPQLSQPMPISWEDVVEAMRTDATRTYIVDIETDSTLSATQDSDMQGLRDVLTAITQIMSGFGPAVQQGAMPIEAVKEVMLAVVRRAKLGSAVEDALEKMQQPQPPPDPHAGQAQIEHQKMQAQMQMQQGTQQHEMQMAQQQAQIEDARSQREMQAKVQADQFSAQLTQQNEQHKQAMQDAQITRQNQMEAEREAQKAQLEHEREMQRMVIEQQERDSQREFDWAKVQADNATKVTVAEIAAKSAMDNTLASAEQNANAKVAEVVKPDNSEVMDAIGKLGDKVAEIHEHAQAPVTIVRGADGKATGVNRGEVTKSIKRGPDGRMEGM